MATSRSGGIVSCRDAGQYLAYIRAVGRRREAVKLEPDGSCSPPHAYEPKPIARP
jgi:hypothetical protein